MILNANTKRIVFIVLAIILLLSVILPLVVARFEHEGIQPQHSKASLWAGKIIFFVSMLLVVSLVALFFYADRLRSRVDTIELAARMRIVVSIIPWLTIVLLILIEARFVIILYRGLDHFVFTSIKFLFLGLCLGFSLFYSWPVAQYCRTKPLCNVVAVCLLEQHEKFVKASDLDKAYSALVKACETAPDEIELWCKLAFFCAAMGKDQTETDKYMSKAEELMATKNEGSNTDKVCYLYYRGAIFYERGEHEKGLEYLKQAIEIEPKPEIIKLYEIKLSEWREKQQGPGNNAG